MSSNSDAALRKFHDHYDDCSVCGPAGSPDTRFYLCSKGMGLIPDAGLSTPPISEAAKDRVVRLVSQIDLEDCCDCPDDPTATGPLCLWCQLGDAVDCIQDAALAKDAGKYLGSQAMKVLCADCLSEGLEDCIHSKAEGKC